MVMLQHTVRKPKGHVFITDPDGGVAEGDTLQCVHCQMHWVVRPGSGTKRGWCYRCNGPTCGKPQCMGRCVPFEKAMELAERRAKLLSDIERI